MKSLAVIAFLLVVSSIAASDVVVLTDTNFDSTLKDIPLALVEFYAPWCGHCKNLEPQWEEAATKLKDDEELSSYGAKLAKIDADSQKSTGGKYRVTGFPTIKLFRSGMFVEDFEGERNVNGILDALRKHSKVAVNKEITSVEELKKLTNVKNLEKTTIVGFFPDKAGVDYKYFSQVIVPFASNGIDAYHSVTPAVLDAFGFFGDRGAIVMYRPHPAKPTKVVYPGKIYKNQLQQWVVNNAVPSVGRYSPATEGLYKLSKSPLVRFLSKAGAADTKLLNALSTKFANVKFAISDVADYKAEVDAQCGADAEQCILGRDLRGQVFGQAGAFAEDTAAKFVDDLLNKKLKAKVKSEPVPAAAGAGQVQVVVGSSFESVVADDSRDVLIEFYAPWCGHCKRLEPIYDELAKEVAHKHDDLLIAKLDLTSNDLPAEYSSVYAVQGFPTIYFAKKGKKLSPQKYEGERDIAGFKAFLTQQGAL
jgi:protein disulfide isomerase